MDANDVMDIEADILSGLWYAVYLDYPFSNYYVLRSDFKKMSDFWKQCRRCKSIDIYVLMIHFEIDFRQTNYCTVCYKPLIILKFTDTL